MSQILFEHVAVFDGESEQVAPAQHVLIEGKRIRELSDTPIKAPEAQRIDGRGKTLMPGLIDNHVHVYLHSHQLLPPQPPLHYKAHYAARYLRHSLDCGFTSVRDVAGGDHALSRALNDGLLAGPRLFYGGLALSPTGGHGDYRNIDDEPDWGCCIGPHNHIAIMADGVDACLRATREELRKGAHHIKIVVSGGVASPSDPLDSLQYSDEEIRAIVGECDRHGKYVAAHAHPAHAVRRAVDLGVRSIEHGTMMTDEVAAHVAAHGAYVVPTLSTMQAMLEDGPQLGMSAASMEKLKTVSEVAMAGLESMRRHAVQVGLGTDLLGSHHVRRDDELRIRSEVFTPLEILRSATSINARILQREGELGCVREGALADLLLVEGNPLDDLSLLFNRGQYMSHIMLNGRLIKEPS